MTKLIKLMSSAIAIACLLMTPLKANEEAFAGPYIGINAAVVGVEADASHNDNQGNVTTGTAGKVATIAGAELGYAIPMGGMILDIGGTFFSGEAKLASKSDLASKSNTTEVKFQVEDMWTAYIAPTFVMSDTSSIYFKYGVVEAETSVSGDVTAPGDLSGETYAIGTRTVLDTGLFVRSEAGLHEFDSISVTGKGTANGITTTTKITADPTIAYGSISVGYKF